MLLPECNTEDDTSDVKNIESFFKTEQITELIHYASRHVRCINFFSYFRHMVLSLKSIQEVSWNCFLFYQNQKCWRWQAKAERVQLHQEIDYVSQKDWTWT